jgi:hypothetical protein
MIQDRSSGKTELLRSDLRFGIRDIIVLTTLVSIAMPWVASRHASMAVSARWNFCNHLLIALSLPLLRIVGEFGFAYYRSHQGGRLLFRHSYHQRVLWMMRLVFLGILATQVFILARFAERAFPMSRLSIERSLFSGLMMSFFLPILSTGRMHIELFELGYAQGWRFRRWDQYQSIEIRCMPTYATLVVTPKDQPPNSRRRIPVRVPIERLPELESAVGIVSTKMATT